MPSQSPRWPFGSAAQLGYAVLANVIGTVTLGAIAFGVLWPYLLQRRPFFSGSPAELLSTGITLTCSVLLVYVLLVRVARTSLAELGWQGGPRLSDLAAGLVGFAVTETLFVLAFFGGSLERFGHALTQFSLGQRLEAILCGVQAAFFEETLYRGYLQQGLEKRLPVLAAVALTSALFSLKHFRFDPMSLGLFFCYGAVWGILRSRTQRLYASGFAHLLNWAVNAFI